MNTTKKKVKPDFDFAISKKGSFIQTKIKYDKLIVLYDIIFFFNKVRWIIMISVNLIM